MQLVRQKAATTFGEIGFTCGAFDLLHPGHVLALKEAKEVACNYLIVGLHTDPSIDRPQTKNKPVMTVEERRILLEGCRYVDEIVVYSTEADLYEFLKTNARSNGGRIDVRIIGADYIGKNFTGRDLPIPIFYNSRDHDFSSTNFRRRIAEAQSQLAA